ncbi:unnamed protein product [Ambrosiozyma monospora]|uniref:Unnamed protein product n=1 Tax=Ambrosiozyma monospora TaxID=43982 RepID=A0A9W7DKP0_AMBMO|nr:unnamed protein product [Ambrosiozyma monospora]
MVKLREPLKLAVRNKLYRESIDTSPDFYVARSFWNIDNPKFLNPKFKKFGKLGYLPLQKKNDSRRKKLNPRTVVCFYLGPSTTVLDGDLVVCFPEYTFSRDTTKLGRGVVCSTTHVRYSKSDLTFKQWQQQNGSNIQDDGIIDMTISNSETEEVPQHSLQSMIERNGNIDLGKTSDVSTILEKLNSYDDTINETEEELLSDLKENDDDVKDDESMDIQKIMLEGDYQDVAKRLIAIPKNLRTTMTDHHDFMEVPVEGRMTRSKTKIGANDARERELKVVWEARERKEKELKRK